MPGTRVIFFVLADEDIVHPVRFVMPETLRQTRPGDEGGSGHRRNDQKTK